MADAGPIAAGLGRSVVQREHGGERGGGQGLRGHRCASHQRKVVQDVIPCGGHEADVVQALLRHAAAHAKSDACAFGGSEG